MIGRDTPVEDLTGIPGLVTWFIRHGVSPFSCSGAFPGTLGRLLEIKGVQDIDAFIAGLDAAFGPEAGPGRDGP